MRELEKGLLFANIVERFRYRENNQNIPDFVRW